MISPSTWFFATLLGVLAAAALAAAINEVKRHYTGQAPLGATPPLRREVLEDPHLVLGCSFLDGRQEPLDAVGRPHRGLDRNRQQTLLSFEPGL